MTLPILGAPQLGLLLAKFATVNNQAWSLVFGDQEIGGGVVVEEDM